MKKKKMTESEKRWAELRIAEIFYGKGDKYKKKK